MTQLHGGHGKLSTRHLTLAYDKTPVCQDVSLDIPCDTFTVIIGPNGCGKSTLLKALARSMRPVAGHVMLDDASIFSYPSKEVARRVSLLPQHAVIPEGIKVYDLVSRGRYPHHSLLRQSAPEDRAAIDSAIELTGIGDLLNRPVAELSGGQRQRVWVAMTLAQQAPTLLLDEPTTSLDIAYQYEILELFSRLQRGELTSRGIQGSEALSGGLHGAGRTIVAVLHDLNQAARFADHLIVIRAGEVVSQGRARDVVTEDLVEDVFALKCKVMPDPQAGTPMVIPVAKQTGRITQ